MADINQVITLGIGTPSDIEHFTLFGLTIAPLGVKYVNLYERPIAVTVDDRDVATSLDERDIAVSLEVLP